MIKPISEDRAPPKIDIEQDQTNAQAQLSPTLTTTASPLAGGMKGEEAGAGNYAIGKSGNGNSNSIGSCLDAEWVKAVNAG
jgi:hypothetical protein